VRLLRSLGLVASFAFAIACGGGAPPAAPTTATPVAATPSAPEGPPATDDDVQKATKAYLDFLVELRPESASELGIHDADDRLEDRTEAGQKKIIEREDAMADGLDKAFANAKLSKSATVDLRILKGALRVDARMRREMKPWARRPDFYTEPMNSLFLMNAREYAPAADRAKNSLSRIEKIPDTLKEAKTTIANAPVVWVQVGAESAHGAKEFFDSMRPFLEKALPQEKPRSIAALKAAKAAYADYQTYLEKEVKPDAPEGQFAAGRDLFNWLLREEYFLKEDAEALLTIGIRVFGETSQKLDETAKRIDPSADGWQAVVKRLKGKHPTATDLLASYRKEMARARKFLVDKDIVELPPGDECQVIETPPFQRTTLTAAYDQPPPFAAQTKGLFFVTPIEPSMTKAQREQMLRENDFGDIVDTVVHETYPGHHLQLSFARTNPSLIRKATGPSILTEGWALYTEELMSEQGYYRDEERLMQLVWTLVRAARVIIDVGLHTKNMTFDEAVKMLTDQVGLERELALSEVKRYTMTPTQPLAYLIGREKIFALRDRVKAKEGKAFALKKFHKELLTRGTIAPALIEEEMFAE
jgi:uncharacterized protein (DUF885 family)